MVVKNCLLGNSFDEKCWPNDTDSDIAFGVGVALVDNISFGSVSVGNRGSKYGISDVGLLEPDFAAEDANRPTRSWDYISYYCWSRWISATTGSSDIDQSYLTSHPDGHDAPIGAVRILWDMAYSSQTLYVVLQVKTGAFAWTGVGIAASHHAFPPTYSSLDLWALQVNLASSPKKARVMHFDATASCPNNPDAGASWHEEVGWTAHASIADASVLATINTGGNRDGKGDTQMTLAHSSYFVYEADDVDDLPEDALWSDSDELLAGALNDSQTDMDVDDGDTFEVGDRIKVDDEVMHITGIVGDTLTVTRAYEGSAAAAHADDAPVYVKWFDYECWASYLKADSATGRWTATGNPCAGHWRGLCDPEEPDATVNGYIAVTADGQSAYLGEVADISAADGSQMEELDGVGISAISHLTDVVDDVGLKHGAVESWKTGTDNGFGVGARVLTAFWDKKPASPSPVAWDVGHLAALLAGVRADASSACKCYGIIVNLVGAGGRRPTNDLEACPVSGRRRWPGGVF